MKHTEMVTTMEDMEGVTIFVMNILATMPTRLIMMDFVKQNEKKKKDGEKYTSKNANKKKLKNVGVKNIVNI